MLASADPRWATRAGFIRPLLSLLVIPALALFSAGCSGRAAELCDEICDCENCSDREYDDCVNDYEYRFDVADAYDCYDEADRAYECALDHNDCIARVWSPGVSCVGDLDDLSRCEYLSSSVRHDDLPGPQ